MLWHGESPSTSALADLWHWYSLLGVHLLSPTDGHEAL